ncbi:MAG TPA: amino acid ABC transporter substrate-binding protein [Candidatus Methylomirabilis sp.]|jgi:branched-chain amino acid transport system substrate-binding protein|nr:amino acid ABC transporter substrate-binding protein [Candidatus Methylomirabilis sp.]
MTRPTKRLFAGTVALALLAALVGAAAAQNPIRIGASLSLTGTYSALGQNQNRGYQLCAKHVNAKGGVLGRKVEFVLYDDQSQPATGVRLYEKLITEDKVDAVMGPYSSAITEAVANVTEKYKMPMVAPMASTTSIFKKGRKFIFMVQSAAEVYLEGLIDMAAKRGLKTVALVNEDTLFPKATIQGTIELAKQKGLQVVFVEGYPKGNTDFSALLTKIRAANPDVLGAATYFDDAVAITRQMKELNVNPKLYGVTVGGDLPKFYELLGKNSEFVYGATQWEAELPYPGSKEFITSYKKEFPGADLSYHSAGGYAGCQVLVEGIRRAGSLDGEKIRAEILKMDTTTVYGGFKVDDGGFQISHKMVTFQWQDGKKVIVWPDELAEGKARFPTPAWSER